MLRKITPCGSEGNNNLFLVYFDNKTFFDPFKNQFMYDKVNHLSNHDSASWKDIPFSYLLLRLFITLDYISRWSAHSVVHSVENAKIFDQA